MDDKRISRELMRTAQKINVFFIKEKWASNKKCAAQKGVVELGYYSPGAGGFKGFYVKSRSTTIEEIKKDFKNEGRYIEDFTTNNWNSLTVEVSFRFEKPLEMGNTSEFSRKVRSLGYKLK